jgi:hypothetical protein
MKPTEQQIETAIRLQELGLCQGAENVIISQSNSYEIISKEDFIEGAASEEAYEINLVGIIPTAAECWLELLKIGCFDDILDMVILIFSDPNTDLADLDEAFRQALIALKEGE